jgi:hypothetical protein
MPSRRHACRPFSAISPIEQLDRVHDRHAGAIGNLAMQPMLPVAITSAFVAVRFFTLRSRSLVEISGCIML